MCEKVAWARRWGQHCAIGDSDLEALLCVMARLKRPWAAITWGLEHTLAEYVNVCQHSLMPGLAAEDWPNKRAL